MKSFFALATIILMCAATALAGNPAVSMGKVEAIYHEGVMSFNVDHPDAASASVKVYDSETDALVYDSGARLNTTVTWPAGHEVKGTYRYVVTAWNEAGEVVVSQVATKSLTPINSFDFDNLTANTRLLGPNEVIVDSDLQVADPEQFRVDRDICANGIGVYWRDEAGSTNMTIEPDCTGDGIFLSAGATGTSFTISNQAFNNQTQAGFFGDSDFQIITGDTGTDSVLMPADAVSATEMENEAGVAAALSGGSLALSSSASAVLTRSLTAPTSGYVLALATADMQLSHTNGTSDIVNCGVSLSSTSIPSDGDQTLQINSAAPSGIYNIPISMNRIFSVSPGLDTYYVVCQETSGSVTAFDRHLDLVFIPSAYGAVTTESIGGDGDMEGIDGYVSPNAGMTEAEIEAEQTESMAVNLARIQAELDAIQAQMDAAAAELVNNP
jgi:hypothetical protein